MMEQMTKDDLKTGMHVVTRNGTELVVLKDTVFDEDVIIAVYEDESRGNWISLNNYHNNLIHKAYADFDIVKIYQPTCEYSVFEHKFNRCPNDNSEMLIFEEETMTKAEAEQKFGIRITD